MLKHLEKHVFLLFLQWRNLLQGILQNTSSSMGSQLDRLPNNTVIMNFLNNQNSTLNVSNFIDSIDNMFRNTIGIFDCLDHQYFVGYNDEDSMVRRAVNTSTSPAIASK